MSYFAAYAEENVLITNQSGIQGRVGTSENGDITVQDFSSVKGDVYSGGDCYVRSSATVTGDLTARNNCIVDNTDDISGVINEQTPTLEFNPDYTHDDVEYGRGISIGDDITYRIQPGDYFLIETGVRSTVILEPETYNLRRFTFSDDCTLKFDIGHEDEIKIYVLDEMSFGLRFETEFTGAVNPLAVKFYTLQTDSLILPHNSVFHGIFRAPNSNVTLAQQTTLYGSLYAKNIVVQHFSKICKPPILTDITHSEWAYAPPFDPDITKYTAIVPQATDSLLVTPTAENPAYQLQVNGSSPENLVSINSNPEEILIEVSGGDCGLSTVYTLSARKDPDDNYAVRVKGDAAGTPQDGKTWNTAFRKLEIALLEARKCGKEIWIAEGIYKKYGDGFCYQFLLYPGLELTGGFSGTESQKKPEGSIYATIIDGDCYGNDNEVTSWPPSQQDIEDHLSDNAHHVFTLFHCGKGAISTKVEGLTIRNGFAHSGTSRALVQEYYDNQPSRESMDETGIYYIRGPEPIWDDNYGAGFYLPHGAPAISKCVIKNNYSNRRGAGLFGRSGPNVLKNCLFEENRTNGAEGEGDGGGVFIAGTKNTTIDGCVFDNNSMLVSLPGEGSFGGGVYALSSNIDFVNTIFYENYATASGGAIYNRSGSLKITNCTFTNNGGITIPGGAGAIHNDTTGNVISCAEIVNTILWNNHESHTSELVGDSFSVSYSCVEGGYAGEGNIDKNPKFKNGDVPEGEDGNYGTMDDGLSLTGSSPCIMKGSEDNYPEKDILSFLRGMKSPNCDQGAYTYIPTSDFLGIIRNGEFIKVEQFPIMKDVTSEKEINLSIVNGYSRIVKGELPKNKYTKKKDVITAYVQVIDSYRQPVGMEVKIKAYRVGSSQIFQSFLFENGKPKGKHILFVSEDTSDDLIGEHTYAYLVKGVVGGKVRIKVKYDQFK